MRASCLPPARQAAQGRPPAVSLDLVLLQGGDHLLKLLALNWLQGSSCLAQKQDLRRVGDILNEVIDRTLVVESVVKLKLALAPGLVDEGDGVRRVWILSRRGADPGEPEASEQRPRGRRSSAVSHAPPRPLSGRALLPRSSASRQPSPPATRTLFANEPRAPGPRPPRGRVSRRGAVAIRPRSVQHHASAPSPPAALRGCRPARPESWPAPARSWRRGRSAPGR